NRVIKSRAWDTGVSRFVDSKYFTIGSMETGNGGYLVYQQFTGLTDKNGKEIYEGDILKVKEFDGTCDVKWDDKRFGWSPYINSEDTCFEVIGNVFENPEL